MGWGKPRGHCSVMGALPTAFTIKMKSKNFSCRCCENRCFDGGMNGSASPLDPPPPGPGDGMALSHSQAPRKCPAKAPAHSPRAAHGGGSGLVGARGFGEALAGLRAGADLLRA